jgi:hypothetical protein
MPDFAKIYLPLYPFSGHTVINMGETPKSQYPGLEVECKKMGRPFL